MLRKNRCLHAEIRVFAASVIVVRTDIQTVDPMHQQKAAHILQIFVIVVLPGYHRISDGQLYAAGRSQLEILQDPVISGTGQLLMPRSVHMLQVKQHAIRQFQHLCKRRFPAVAAGIDIDPDPLQQGGGLPDKGKLQHRFSAGKRHAPTGSLIIVAVSAQQFCQLLRLIRRSEQLHAAVAAGRLAPPAACTAGRFDPMLSVFHPMNAIRADLYTHSAVPAEPEIYLDLPGGRNGFRIVTPRTVQRAALHKYCRPDPGAVADGKALNVKNIAFHITLPSGRSFPAAAPERAKRNTHCIRPPGQADSGTSQDVRPHPPASFCLQR